ncbi:MAG: tRNA preQ1(34) S-adenosylmethionine ribosyltransferase-isomerase QueA [Clostridia bacterium]
MKKNDFHYTLPRELIAQHPAEKRDMSRLLVVHADTGEISHGHFKDILEYLEDGDCLVVNETKVIPARLLGKKVPTGGKVEFVLLERMENDVWEILMKPGRKGRPGGAFTFGDGLLDARVLATLDQGNKLVQFSYEGVFEEVLDRVGIIPLPPYITEKLEDRERYQTVYAAKEGSSAAPTAGLHFTRDLLSAIEKKGTDIARITLHVGVGTFRPVKEENIEDHAMHSEYYKVDEDAARLINRARKNKKKVIAVGTTSTRVLESISDDQGFVKPSEGHTDIFIYPGYRFKAVDTLITNFHLPESTLIMLVSAFAGKDLIMKAYQEAIDHRYRFFSFGDAMLIKKEVPSDE